MLVDGTQLRSVEIEPKMELRMVFFFTLFIYLLMYILHHSVTKLTIYNIILKSTYTLYNFEFTFDLHITYIFVAMHISKTF